CVAPKAEVLVLAKVLVADVESARECAVAVHDKDLAVISQVDLDSPAQWIQQRQERYALSAGLAKLPNEVSGEAVRAHRIVKQTDLDSAPRFLRQRVNKCFSAVVRLKDKVLEMDVVLCISNGFQLSIIGRLAFVVKRDTIAARRWKSLQAL